MKTRRIFFILIFLLNGSFIAFTQDRFLEPVGIGETMGDFTLKTLQGDMVNTATLRGKNLLLIFPRGKVLEEMWCPLCYYQYAEIAALEKKTNMREKYNLEILYVLPYPEDSVILWKKAAGKGLQTIENWKYPEGYDTLTGPVKRWADYVRDFFPETFSFPNGEIVTPIPVLMDEDKGVSSALYLYTHEWGGTKAAQNMPTVFILDKKGVVRFKYHSQYTNDRPTAEYLLEYMKKML